MAAHMTFSEAMPADMNEAPTNDFRVCARYYEPMDVVLYLQEDLAYRADRVDPFLTLLWHPDTDKAIGIKLKGARWIFKQLQEILESSGQPLSESDFVPLISAIQVAMTAGAGAAMVADVERARLAEKYDQAKAVARGAKFDSSQLRLALAA